LQIEEAAALRGELAALDRAVLIIESEPITAAWRRALKRLANDNDARAILRGFAVRALYDQGELAAAEAGGHLSRALSRAAPSSEAAHWLDGFLGEAGQILLYDTVLVGLIDAWITGLREDDFIALLPMLRRAFASFDRSERRRLLDSCEQPVPASAGANGQLAVAPSAASMRPASKRPCQLLTILGLDAEKRDLMSAVNPKERQRRWRLALGGDEEAA
jgi:hypothetical protein